MPSGAATNGSSWASLNAATRLLSMLTGMLIVTLGMALVFCTSKVTVSSVTGALPSFSLKSSELTLRGVLLWLMERVLLTGWMRIRFLSPLTSMLSDLRRRAIT